MTNEEQVEILKRDEKVDLAFVLLLAFAFGVWGCDSRVRSQPGPTAILQPDVVPNVELRTADDIATVDVAVDDAGSLHVAWNAAIEEIPGTLPRHATYYSRGDAGGAQWTEPTLIAATLPPLRLLIARDRLHVIAGPTLRHFVADSPGLSWREVGALLPEGPRGSIALDLALSDSGPILAYLRRPKAPYDPNDRGPEHRQELVALRLLEAGTEPLARVSFFAPAMSAAPGPRLLVEGETIHLLTGINEDVRTPVQPNATPTVGVRGRVLSFSSDDGGRRWQRRGEIAPAGDSFEPLEDLDLAFGLSGMLAFVSAYGVFASHSADGRQWSPAARIDSQEPGLSGTRKSSSIAAGEGWVAWIDQRFRKTDSRWWNPLGGVPWSDDTQLWANNDVFGLHFSEVAALLRGEEARSPARLTPELTFAQRVRVGRLQQRPFVLWAGRRRVGKHLRDLDEPPEIFYRTVPIDRAGR